MSDASTEREVGLLTRVERLAAGAAGAVLLAVALTVVVAPPDRRVALQQCPSASANCIVTVDNDLTTFAAVLAAIGAAAILIAVLGIRFNKVKAGGAELGYEKATAGLTRAEPAADGAADAPTTAPPERPVTDLPVKVDVRTDHGKLGTPVAVTWLARPMQSVDSQVLRDYQLARRASQHSYFLTHILGPATQPGQRYSVAVRLTPHRTATDEVKSATFYLGRAWGHRVFEGRRGADGRFGIVTEAYGPFLALCAVEFGNGDRILLDHYCDFDMGSLLPA